MLLRFPGPAVLRRFAAFRRQAGFFFSGGVVFAPLLGFRRSQGSLDSPLSFNAALLGGGVVAVVASVLLALRRLLGLCFSFCPRQNLQFCRGL